MQNSFKFMENWNLMKKKNEYNEKKKIFFKLVQ